MSLPPLKALRAFDVAGRHLNFSSAAQELGVTAGAVSRQIATLEAFLGVKLFIRGHRAIHLSPEGDVYWKAMAGLLRRIESTTDDLLARNQARPLRIRGARLFLRQWLSPRLGRFRDAYPAIEVILSTIQHGDDFAPDVDVWIRYGNGEWPPGMRSHLLMRSMLLPVCSPRYLRSHGPLVRGASLTAHTILHTPTSIRNWSAWLAAADIHDSAETRRISFEGDAGLAYQAAVDGAGIALARRPLIEGDLAAGRVVAAIDFAVELDDALYLVYAHEDRHIPRITAFRTWLLKEIGNSRASGDSRAAL